MDSGDSAVRGVAALREPLLNPGTAYSSGDRDALELRGFLPPAVESPEYV